MQCDYAQSKQLEQVSERIRLRSASDYKDLISKQIKYFAVPNKVNFGCVHTIIPTEHKGYGSNRG